MKRYNEWARVRTERWTEINGIIIIKVFGFGSAPYRYAAEMDVWNLDMDCIFRLQGQLHVFMLVFIYYSRTDQKATARHGVRYCTESKYLTEM
jgi:hypothetical protein